MVFSGIWISRSFSEAKLLDGLSGKKDMRIGSDIEKRIRQIEDTIAADDAMKKQEYEKALRLISGDSDQDYYNRATIQTLIAYKNAIQDTLS